MTLPHGHTRRNRSRLVLTLLLAACAAPAFAASPANPVAATAAPAAAPAIPAAPATDAGTPSGVAAPVTAAAASPLLPAPAALATPDTAPLAQQLQALQAASSAQAGTSSTIKTVLQRALALLGTPYRWGGSNPDRGFDCSGLVGYVFSSIGIDLPRVSRAMANEGIAVTDPAALAEGDLVFFGRRGRIDHVGIYLGNGNFLHAPRTGRDVTVSSLTTGYWADKFMQARRVLAGN